MRSFPGRLALLLVAATAMAAFGGYRVGRAAPGVGVAQPPANPGLVRALASVGQNLFGGMGDISTEFFAFASTSTLTPSEPLKPDNTVVLEVSEAIAIELRVNVIRPADDTTPCRAVYQLRIGNGRFSTVSDVNAGDPSDPNREDLNNPRPHICPSPDPRDGG